MTTEMEQRSYAAGYDARIAKRSCLFILNLIASDKVYAISTSKAQGGSMRTPIAGGGHKVLGLTFRGNPLSEEKASAEVAMVDTIGYAKAAVDAHLMYFDPKRPYFGVKVWPSLGKMAIMEGGKRVANTMANLIQTSKNADEICSHLGLTADDIQVRVIPMMEKIKARAVAAAAATAAAAAAAAGEAPVANAAAMDIEGANNEVMGIQDVLSQLKVEQAEQEDLFYGNGKLKPSKIGKKKNWAVMLAKIRTLADSSPEVKGIVEEVEAATVKNYVQLWTAKVAQVKKDIGTLASRRRVAFDAVRPKLEAALPHLVQFHGQSTARQHPVPELDSDGKVKGKYKVTVLSKRKSSANARLTERFDRLRRKLRRAKAERSKGKKEAFVQDKVRRVKAKHAVRTAPPERYWETS